MISPFVILAIGLLCGFFAGYGWRSTRRARRERRHRRTLRTIGRLSY